MYVCTRIIINLSNMKKIFQWALVAFFSIYSMNMFAAGTTINYRLASADETRKLMQANSEYYNKMNQMDIDWRVRKDGSTLEELKTMAYKQTRDWTEAEREFMKTVVGIITDSLNSIGCQLPMPPEIVFAKTTQIEEGGSGGYTIKNIIFLGEMSIGMCMPNADRTAEENKLTLMWFTELVTHELFHCLSRYSPAFRQKMYEQIGFTVMDQDITFPDDIRERLVINPDVEHIDNYATFTIDGEKRRCELIVLYDKTWAKASAEKGDQIAFFEFIRPALVPLDDMTKVYDTNEINDFWETVGRNTSYVIAPEECMADNFSYAVIRGTNPASPYKTPELIKKIITALKQL